MEWIPVTEILKWFTSVGWQAGLCCLLALIIYKGVALIRIITDAARVQYDQAGYQRDILEAIRAQTGHVREVKEVAHETRVAVIDAHRAVDTAAVNSRDSLRELKSASEAHSQQFTVILTRLDSVTTLLLPRQELLPRLNEIRDLLLALQSGIDPPEPPSPAPF